MGAAAPSMKLVARGGLSRLSNVVTVTQTVLVAVPSWLVTVTTVAGGVVTIQEVDTMVETTLDSTVDVAVTIWVVQEVILARNAILVLLLRTVTLYFPLFARHTYTGSFTQAPLRQAYPGLQHVVTVQQEFPAGHVTAKS